MCDRTLSCNATEKNFYGPFSQCPALPQFTERPQDLEVDDGEAARFVCVTNRDKNTIKRYIICIYYLKYDSKLNNTVMLLKNTFSM